LHGTFEEGTRAAWLHDLLKPVDRLVCRCTLYSAKLICSARFYGETMLVVMHSHATAEQVRAVCERIESLGLKSHPIPGAARTAIGITGNDGAVDLAILESLPGVAECIPVSKP